MGEENAQNTKVKLIGTCEVLRTMEMSLLCFPRRLVAGGTATVAEKITKSAAHIRSLLVFGQTKMKNLIN